MSVSPSAPTYQSGTKSVAPDNAAEDAAARASAFHFLSQLAAEVSAGVVDLPCFPDSGTPSFKAPPWHLRYSR
jgi:hypothetical protein